jgi:hypothetical protein
VRGNRSLKRSRFIVDWDRIFSLEASRMLKMEIDKVRKLLSDIALAHPKDGDSKEIEALRNISTALLHMAEAVEDIQRRLPAKSEYF